MATLFTPVQAKWSLPSFVVAIFRTTPPPEGIAVLGRLPFSKLFCCRIEAAQICALIIRVINRVIGCDRNPPRARPRLRDCIFGYGTGLRIDAGQLVRA